MLYFLHIFDSCLARLTASLFALWDNNLSAFDGLLQKEIGIKSTQYFKMKGFTQSSTKEEFKTQLQHKRGPSLFCGLYYSSTVKLSKNKLFHTKQQQDNKQELMGGIQQRTSRKDLMRTRVGATDLNTPWAEVPFGVLPSHTLLV